MITHYFPNWRGNSMLIILEKNEAVLIDTPYDGIATKALLDWIRKTFGELKLHAIVTGFHQDNLGGNEVLIENEIPVYGLQLTTQLVKSKGEEIKQVLLELVKNNDKEEYYRRYSNLNLIPPSRIFDLEKGESKVIKISNEKFEFFYPGESHTVDNSVVYMHNSRVLFGGCMIRALSDDRPGYIKYANMKEWPLSVELVMKHYPNPKIIIPGHGFEGDFQLLQHTVDILYEWNRTNEME